MTPPAVDDAAIDASAASAFFAEYGDRGAHLPPVAIVIAAYNEESGGAIGQVVETLPKNLCGLDAAVIVVSDGSQDKTAVVARDHGAMVCDVPVNRGQGAALRLGYRLARDGGATYIVTTDADGQYNPAEMESVLAPVVAGEADFCTGSRTMGSEESRAVLRRLGVRVFARTISTLTGQRISDTTFGLRAMRAEVTGDVQLEQPQYQAAELLIGVMARGFQVAEVPATIHKRRVGKSKKGNDVLYGYNFTRVVLGTWWRERQRRAPGSATGVPGSDRPAGSPAQAVPLTRAAEPLEPNGSEPFADGSSSSPDSGSVAGDGGTLDPRSAKRT
ncbi:MAG TPA: glycosyltransferase family 2 protein [Streptosporangiaceae bacterium]